VRWQSSLALKRNNTTGKKPEPETAHATDAGQDAAAESCPYARQNQNLMSDLTQS
jgi:hypothetical protein